MVKKEDDFIVDDEELEAESGSDEAEFTGSGSDSGAAKKSKKSSKKAAPAKSKSSKARESDTKPAAKKRKVSDDEGDDKPEGSSKASLSKNAEGDYFANLGSNKRITVRQFKGKTYIDIREYYMDKNSEELKPGKKGIALTPETWQAMKDVLSAVDGEVNRLDGKKK